MDRLFIDNKEVEFGGEVGLYLTYRSNIMNPDISKILGNNSSTIKIPHTQHNASIIENAQMVTSDTRFPYIKHSADVLRDGIILIQGATVILLKTTPEEYELSLVWGVSEGLRQMAENGDKLSALAGYLPEKYPWVYDWQGGNMEFPEAVYGFMRYSNNGRYWYHPTISLMEIMTAIIQQYGVDISVPQSAREEMEELVMPILQSNRPAENVYLEKNGTNQGEDMEWDDISQSSLNYNAVIQRDDVQLTTIDVDITAKGRSLIEETGDMDSLRVTQDACTLVVVKKEIDNGEVTYTDIAELPCTSIAIEDAGVGYRDYFLLHFKVRLEGEQETFNAGDSIIFRFREKPVSEDLTNIFTVDEYIDSHAVLTLQQTQSVLGQDYYIGINLPDMEVIKWLKGVMQMLGLFAFQGNDGNIYLTSYNSFFSQTSNARDWSDYLCMTSTHASEEQEFKADGFFRKNWVRYKNDDDIKKMDSFFFVDSEVLEAEGDYVSLPFDSVVMMTGDQTRQDIAKIPLYDYKEEKENDKVYWKIELNKNEQKKAYVLRRESTFDGKYYLSRRGLDWDTLLSTSYQGIIQSIQQAHYITATFYLDAPTLQRVDFRYPIYLSQYASYFAIIEIKTKANNLAEVKLLKLV